MTSTILPSLFTHSAVTFHFCTTFGGRGGKVTTFSWIACSCDPPAPSAPLSCDSHTHRRAPAYPPLILSDKVTTPPSILGENLHPHPPPSCSNGCHFHLLTKITLQTRPGKAEPAESFLLVTSVYWVGGLGVSRSCVCTIKKKSFFFRKLSFAATFSLCGKGRVVWKLLKASPKT